MSGPDTAPILSHALLDELEQRWRDHKLPIIDRLRPGLTDDQIDELTAPLGLRLPEEARTWWRWHNGVDLTGTSRDWGFDPGLMVFAPLDRQVEHYGKLRSRSRSAALADPEAGHDEDYWWPPTWFALTKGKRSVVCDCAAPGATSPIYAYDVGVWEELHTPRADSFGQVVAWWIRAYDDGIWRYDHGKWSRAVERHAALSAQPGQEGSHYFL